MHVSRTTPPRSTLSVTTTTLTLSRDGSGAQFTRVIFDQSIDNGVTWTLLGTATNNLTVLANGKGENPFAPNAAGYTLGGQSIPTGQNVLIRARGFCRSGYQNGSETTEDKVQIAYLFPVLAANVSVSGRVLTSNGNGLRNAVVTLTDANGISRQTRTSSFGYYRFDDIAAGQIVVLGVSSKRFPICTASRQRFGKYRGTKLYGRTVNSEKLKVKVNSGRTN